MYDEKAVSVLQGVRFGRVLRILSGHADCGQNPAEACRLWAENDQCMQIVARQRQGIFLPLGINSEAFAPRGSPGEKKPERRKKKGIDGGGGLFCDGNFGPINILHVPRGDGCLVKLPHPLS